MTVLSVAQAVAPRIGMEVPTELMASTEREHVELIEIIEDCAKYIAFDVGHDWRLLITLATITGDGATATASRETDFSRMVHDGNLWSSRVEYPLEYIDSADKWLEIDVLSVDYIIGAWTDIGGSLQFKPTPEDGETIKYYYLSDLIVSPAAGNDTASFVADTDTFRLNERLLKLCVIWQWKEAKGLEYAEDMDNFQIALARAIVDDKGRRVISVGRGRRPHGARVAYPRTVS